MATSTQDLINTISTFPELPSPTTANVQGTSFADSLYLYGSFNVVMAYDGADNIYGSYGTDLIAGNAGNDWIDGASGNDAVWAGRGNDTVWGGYGTDMLYGNLDNDYLYGESGDDLIFGGQGDDYISGGAGGDILLGDRGNDTIYSGTGENYFIFGNNSGIDTLPDYSSVFDWFVVYQNVNGTGISTPRDVYNRMTSDGAGGAWVDLGLGNHVHVIGAVPALSDIVII